MTKHIRVTPSVTLSEDEIQETFIRSPGPGGQNVNKVASAVQLKFDIERSPSLPEPIRERLKRLAGRRLTAEGMLLIEAHRFRTQARNRADAREKLFELIRQASVVPKKRKATAPSAAAKQRRLDEKRARGEIKRARKTLDL
ncbi:MAG TPA: alternative ribosome rescue aminoacyl-tRNA hydrolase ArfB [Burkholderiales bacterium]|nr:alternative ribosome rescue aminoacyl-tRNA hydrolase ArfB [Burkholderiales bacterium]